MQKKNIFLVFCHLPICIISLMNAQKHVFGMYVFVYLVICVSKNQGLQWLTLSHYKCVKRIFIYDRGDLNNSHLSTLPTVTWPYSQKSTVTVLKIAYLVTQNCLGRSFSVILNYLRWLENYNISTFGMRNWVTSKWQICIIFLRFANMVAS